MDTTLGHLPRLQNKDARQRSSAAQPEDGAGPGYLSMPAVWNGDEARHEDVGERTSNHALALQD